MIARTAAPPSSAAGSQRGRTRSLCAASAAATRPSAPIHCNAPAGLVTLQAVPVLRTLFHESVGRLHNHELGGQLLAALEKVCELTRELAIVESFIVSDQSPVIPTM